MATNKYGPGNPDWERNQKVLRGEIRPEDVSTEAAGPSVSAPQIPSLAPDSIVAGDRPDDGDKDGKKDR